MNFKIRPRGQKEKGGYACMPLKGNIPQGKKGWKLTTCPECGEACWETPLLRSIKQSDQTLKALCTFCAIKKGANNYRNHFSSRNRDIIRMPE